MAAMPSSSRALMTENDPAQRTTTAITDRWERYLIELVNAREPGTVRCNERGGGCFRGTPKTGVRLKPDSTGAGQASADPG